MAESDLVFDARQRPESWAALGPQTRKVVLGVLDAASSGWDIPADLATRCPALTHLYVWGLQNIEELPVLPSSLQCLDVRNCAALATCPTLPAELERLILEDCPLVGRVPGAERGFSRLVELSLRGCVAIADANLQRLVAGAPRLQILDASGCAALTRIPNWAATTLLDVRLNDCAKLGSGGTQAATLPAWPQALRRLELRGSAVAELPAFPATLDYVDLQACRRLSHLPELGGGASGRPRTLFIHGSGLQLPDELFGDANANRSAQVRAHLEGERAPLHEVKVILLGNGRAGKTSLARRLVRNEFARDEKSTHGILLWTLDLPFYPVGDVDHEAKARLNVWDFAGQDLYHSTHRLFYQSRAVYIVCETAAGDGADPASDHTDDDGLPDGWDDDRHIGYWLDQIAAVGHAPGRTEGPPVLFVRCKAARDDEPGMKEKVEAFWRQRLVRLGDRTRIDFDAQTGQGLEALREWLAAAVGNVLGEPGRREIRRDALAVRAELQVRMSANDVEHESARLAGRPANPPHPTLPRDEFDAMVRRHVANGAFRERPGLLLELFHTAGFLYADEQLLPQTVVLDQRWAIKAIYTAFDRAHWQELCSRRGRCTEQVLMDWGWSGYSGEHRRLFLGFMDSCGMAFPLGDALHGRAQEYVVVRALPEREDCVREAADYRHGIDLSQRVALQHPTLGRDSVLALLARLGRQWGRSAVLWLCGGQFESYRYADEDRERGRTFLHLDWQPTEKDSFGGALTLSLYGGDATLLQAVLAECRKIGGFEQAEIPIVEAPPDEGDVEGLGLPRVPGRADETAGHRPEDDHFNCIEVGISFAGDQVERVEHWQDLPSGSLERWPLALAHMLRKCHGYRVREYRDEQARHHYERGVDRRAFLDDLVSRDFVYVFVSWEYLKSPWCMYEFMRLVESRQDGRQDPAHCAVATFKEAHFSQTRVGGQNPVKQFADSWKAWLAKLDADVKEEAEGAATGIRYETLLRERAFADWARCVDSQERFDRIRRALKSDGWAVEPVEREPTEASVKSWAEKSAVSLARRDALLNLACRAWQQAERPRALRLFVLGFLGADPDGQPEGLEVALERDVDEDTLDDIRCKVLVEVQRAAKHGKPFQDWRALERHYWQMAANREPRREPHS